MSGSSAEQHYNRREQFTKRKRAELRTYALRKYNNAVKRTLINTYAKRGDTVWDNACGKGGDVLKWRDKAVKRVYFSDIAEQSVRTCNERYKELAEPKYAAQFVVCDMTEATPFAMAAAVDAAYQMDVVSCQFALHYAFGTPKNAERALWNVSKALKVGGFFIGTVPDAERIAAFKSNSICAVEFNKKKGTPPNAYLFTLEDAVDKCEEYLVPLNVLDTTAESLGLKRRQWLPFSAVTTQGADKLSPEELEVANLYRAFVFEKIR